MRKRSTALFLLLDSFMLKNYSIVYFGPGEWEGLWRNRHHLMSIFAKYNKVLYVEKRYSTRGSIKALHRRRIGKFNLVFPHIRHIKDNLFVLHYPMWAPSSRYSFVNGITRAIRRKVLQSALQRLGMHKPIVWFSLPDLVDLFNEISFPIELSIYHVVDEYSAYPNPNSTSELRLRIKQLEERMLSLVDTVIVVSSQLYESKSPFNPNTYLVQNGVDYKAYDKALSDSYIPEELKSIKPPRLGYIGLIGDKLDLHMLRDLAKQNPEWSLVFLGEERVVKQVTYWQELKSLPNVHYLGLVDFPKVPYYLKGFNVGLMPYLQSKQAENISPLKLYDYLAAGLPIASIDIPSSREFHRIIHIAKRPEQFAEAVKAALCDNTPERYIERRKVAMQHTWEERAKQISNIIASQLEKKKEE